MNLLRGCIAWSAVVVSSLAIAAHPGVDPTFGSAGVADMPAAAVGLSSSSRMDFAALTRVAGDGANWYLFASNSQNFALARFGVNGQLDPAFGSGGTIQGSFATAFSPTRMAVGLGATGRPLIAAGTLDYFSTILQLRRVTQTGAPDPTFGSNGYASITFPVVVTDNAVVPVSPTHIVARMGGGAYVTMARSAVVAITEQGTVDASFGNGGFFIGSTTVVGYYAYQEVVLGVSPGGRVYVLQQTSDGPRIVRYLANGSLDAAYALALPSSLQWPPIDSLLDGAENLYVSFGTPATDGGAALAIYKLDAQGHLQPTFGSNGIVSIGGTYNGVRLYSAYRLSDVASDGTLMLVAALDPQYYSYTAPIAVRLIDQAGNPVLPFGGKGVTRLETQPIDARYFYAVDAQFDESGRVIVVGVGVTESDAVHAIRLNRSFLHVATLTDPRTSLLDAGVVTPGTRFQYGDAILGDVLIAGDSGPPSGPVRFDVGPWSCPGTPLFAAMPPRAGCYVLADQLGQFGWTLSFPGDEIYGAVQASGPQIRVDKRKLSLGLNFFDAATTVEDYAQATLRWNNPMAQQGTLAYPTGRTRFSLGEATCEAPLDGYGGGTCRLIARQVGTVPWTAQYLNDPFFTSDVVSLGTMDVRPAVKTVALNLVGGAAQLTVDAADVYCGLVNWGAFDPAAQLPSLPRPNPTSFAGSGGILFTTAPGCAPGTTLAVSITYPFDVDPAAELWTYVFTTDGSNGWLRLPASVSGRTVTTSLVDGSAFDNFAHTPGSIGASLVLYNAAGSGSPAEGRLTSLGTYAFGDQPVATASTPATITLTNIGTAPVTVTSITTSNSSEFLLTDVSCSVLAAGAACTIQVTFTPARAGPREGTIVVSSDAEGSPYAIAVNGNGTVSATLPRLIEYHHDGFDHYFVTSIADEISKLDQGAFPGWTRTGFEIPAYAIASAGVTVCRFFSAAFAPKSSHFYTASASECDTVKRNPDWQFEGNVFNIDVPADDGTCPAGTLAVYRVYNNGQGGAPNHRYTTSASVRDQMVATGWIAEGYGPAAVMMCAPGDR